MRPLSLCCLLILGIASCGRTPLRRGDSGPEPDERIGLPDLTVAMLAQVSGRQIQYRATVCNGGTTPSPACALDLYRDPPHRPRAGERGASQQLGPLPPGGCVDVTWSEGNVPFGPHVLWAQVDPDRRVTESFEDNNVAGPIHVHVDPSTELPDLVPDLIEFHLVKGQVQFGVAVCNNGMRKAPTTMVDLYHDRPVSPDPSIPGDQVVKVPALAPNACYFTQPTTSLPLGSYRAWVRVDRKDAVVESNESNNTAHLDYQVLTPKLPELNVKSFSAYVTPKTSYVYYDYSICNTGQTYTGITQVAIHINRSSAPKVGEKGDLGGAVIGLPPGGCVAGKAATKLPQGTYSSWVVADASNDELEVDELNNVEGPLKVTVTTTGGVDLLVTDLVLGPDPVTGGQLYAATVCNQGTALAASTVLDLYTNQAKPPPYGLADASKTISALNGGACTIVPFGVTLQPGVYSSWAWIDRQNFVPELDENNNLSGPFQFTVK